MNKPKKKRRKIIIFTLIGIVLLILIAGAVFGKHAPVVEVQVAKVKRRNLTETVTANGVIQPFTEVKISPEVSGEIVKLPFKEGDRVMKGDLLVEIKPEYYIASRDSARASYESAQASQTTAEAQLARAKAEYLRNKELFDKSLVSESAYVDVKTSYEVAESQMNQAVYQVAMAKAALERAEQDLLKTTILSPLNGTITRLNSRVGERVHGTAMMAGTDIMTIADLDQMDAQVDIGEMDIVLMKPGLKARLEVDAFRDQKFSGVVTEIANSANNSGQSGAPQEATRFQVKIRITDKAAFRPGMSVTADIETRYRTNVITVPIASVTARVLPAKKTNATETVSGGTNAAAAGGESASSQNTNSETVTESDTNTSLGDFDTDYKRKEATKPKDIVWLVEGDHVKAAPVELGISDEDYYEITKGLEEGQEIVTGSYLAISRDLEDGKKIIVTKHSKPGEDKKKGKSE